MKSCELFMFYFVCFHDKSHAWPPPRPVMTSVQLPMSFPQHTTPSSPPTCLFEAIELQNASVRLAQTAHTKNSKFKFAHVFVYASLKIRHRKYDRAQSIQTQNSMTPLLPASVPLPRRQIDLYCCVSMETSIMIRSVIGLNVEWERKNSILLWSGFGECFTKLSVNLRSIDRMCAPRPLIEGA